jgi:hypothetical protein
MDLRCSGWFCIGSARTGLHPSDGPDGMPLDDACQAMSAQSRAAMTRTRTGPMPAGRRPCGRGTCTACTGAGSPSAPPGHGRARPARAPRCIPPSSGTGRGRPIGCSPVAPTRFRGRVQDGCASRVRMSLGRWRPTGERRPASPGRGLAPGRDGLAELLRNPLAGAVRDSEAEELALPTLRPDLLDRPRALAPSTAGGSPPFQHTGRHATRPASSSYPRALSHRSSLTTATWSCRPTPSSRSMSSRASRRSR